MDTETAIVGLKLLHAMRYSLQAFARVMEDGQSDPDAATLINNLGRDLDSLTAWLDAKSTQV